MARYSIGQVSARFDIPISTIRYYDKEGLFPHLERESGIRRFSDRDVETLRLVECLKRSGMEIRDIRTFMDLVEEGPATYGERLELFRRQRASVEDQLERLERTRAMILFKEWYYEQLVAGADEKELGALLPDRLPPEVQALYDRAHEGDATGDAAEAQAA